MRPDYVTRENLIFFITSALKEDIQSGDFSSIATLPNDLYQKAKLIVKQDCVLAGVDLAIEIFKHFDSELSIETFKKDGDFVTHGDVAFIVSGKARSILSTERLVLNCMQRMSGIATLTHSLVAELKDTECSLLDTRKTTPNFRMCEKWAVVIGGGKNHRFGLYDMIMLKDNHIDFSGGIKNAVARTKKFLEINNLNLKIEVETRNLAEVQQALDCNVDRIMLDNMSIEMMQEAVQLIENKTETEASGGITKEKLKLIAATGVNYISMGVLTHSAENIDLSLKAIKET